MKIIAILLGILGIVLFFVGLGAFFRGIWSALKGEIEKSFDKILYGVLLIILIAPTVFIVAFNLNPYYECHKNSDYDACEHIGGVFEGTYKILSNFVGTGSLSSLPVGETITAYEKACEYGDKPSACLKGGNFILKVIKDFEKADEDLPRGARIWDAKSLFKYGCPDEHRENASWEYRQNCKKLEELKEID